MKHVKDLMREMGFREDADAGAKEAFLKHLIKAAHGVDVETPTEKRTRQSKQWLKESKPFQSKVQAGEGEQLSFDFSKEDPRKKVI